MSGASAKTLYALTLVKRGHNYDQAARKAKCSASAVRQQCLKQGIRVNYIPGADVVNIAHLDDLGVSDFKNCQKHGFSPKGRAPYGRGRHGASPYEK